MRISNKVQCRIKSKISNLFFIVPALASFCFSIGYPFLKGITYSFTDWNGVSTKYNFIGFENYIRLFSDSSLLIPLKNSLEYTIVTVIFVNVFGMLLALALNREGTVYKFLRTIFFMPFVVSLILVAYMWRYIYSDIIYPLFGIKSILGNPNTAMLGIIIMCLWRDSGYAMLIYYAGLKSIPKVYYEAAKIDGAGVFAQFRNITLPLLIPALTINIVQYLGWGLQIFDYVMAATGGGPGRATETLAIYNYRLTFPYERAGYGQAASILMMIGIFILTGIITKAFKRKEVEA